MSESLINISIELTRYILPIIIIVGSGGNLFNILILIRPIYRGKTCPFYFLLFSINNLFYSSVILIYRLFLVGYQSNPSRSSLILCKLVQYINDVCPFVSPYILVLASIDRYCNSSTNIKFKSFNQINVAKWTSGFVITFFFLYFLNTPIIIELRDDDGLGCRIRSSSIYNQIYIINQVFLLIILAPFLMILFGLLTIFNLKRMRIVPLSLLQQRRIENQFVRMVLYQVISHILFIFPLSVTYLMLLLPTVYSKMRSFYSIYTICYLPFYVSYGTSFIIHGLSARSYRKESYKLLHKLFKFICRI